MVQLILSSSKGNQGHRYFPYAGYLGLTPVRVEGIVRTKLDADLKPLQAKSITISVRCYESRIGRAGTSATNLLVDYTQVLWQKSPTTHFEPISNLEFPFRIVVPPRVAGFSTAVFVDYRCSWRVEAVLTHAPITGVGSRQIRHFELPLIRYDVPPPLPPLLPSISYAPYPSASPASSSTHAIPFFLHETSKPRAPRIRYTVHAPRTPIGPHDHVAIPIHIQSLDANLTVRSASIIVERRIVLLDATSGGASSSSSSAPIPIPIPGPSSASSSQPNSASRSFPSSSSPTGETSASSRTAGAGADDYPSQKQRPSTSPFPSQHAPSSSSFFGLGSSNSKNASSSSRPASSSGKSRPSSSGKEKEKSSGFTPFAPFNFLSSSSSSSSNNHSNNHNIPPIPNDSQVSFGSGATITQSAISLLSSDTAPLLGSSASSSPQFPAASPQSSASTPTPKAQVLNIAFAESSGAFARVPMPSSTSDPPIPPNSPGSTYSAQTLTLAWPTAKGQSRWAVGSTIANSDVISVRFYLRTKVVVTYQTGSGEDGYNGSSVTESLELKEEEVLVVAAGEAERRAAQEALGGMFGPSSRGASASRERDESGEASGGISGSAGASSDFDAAARRSKSKSPRRIGDTRERDRERERDWDNAAVLMPARPSAPDLLALSPHSAGVGVSGGSIVSSSGSSGHTVRASKSSGAMRRPHTSAGPRDRPPAGYGDRERDVHRERDRDRSDRAREREKGQTVSGGAVPVPLTTYNSTSGSSTEGGTTSGSGSGQISASSSASSSSGYHGMPPPSAYVPPPSAGSTSSSARRRRVDSMGTKESIAAEGSSASSSSKRSKEPRRPDTSSGLISGGRGASGFWSTVHSNPALTSTSPTASAFVIPGGGRGGGGSRGSGSGRPSTSAGVSSGDKEKKSGTLSSFVLGGLGALSGSGSTITPVANNNPRENFATRSTGSTASDSSAITTSSSGRSAEYSNSNSNTSAASGRSHHRHQHNPYAIKERRPSTSASASSNAPSTSSTAVPRGRGLVAGGSGAEREWEEELARIEARSRRSSDLLGFNVGMKSRGASRPPTASSGQHGSQVDLGLSMVHAGRVVDI